MDHNILSYFCEGSLYCHEAYKRSGEGENGKDSFIKHETETAIIIAIKGSTFNTEKICVNYQWFSNLVRYAPKALEGLSMILNGFNGKHTSYDHLQDVANAAHYLSHLQPAQKIYDELQDDFQQTTKEIIICGHSRGGVLAIFLAKLLHEKHEHIANKIRRVVTFAAPAMNYQLSPEIHSKLAEKLYCAINPLDIVNATGFSFQDRTFYIDPTEFTNPIDAHRITSYQAALIRQASKLEYSPAGLRVVDEKESSDFVSSDSCKKKDSKRKFQEDDDLDSLTEDPDSIKPRRARKE